MGSLIGYNNWDTVQGGKPTHVSIKTAPGCVTW